jgi:uncharacterized protein YidB (DUF937 family)
MSAMQHKPNQGQQRGQQTMGLQDILGKLGGQQGQEGGVATIKKLFGSDGMQGILSKLNSNGLGQQVQSWIGRGQNQSISGTDIQQAVDPTTLQQTAQQQGMSPEELSNQVAQALPEMVDQATPDGQMPSQDPFTQGFSALRKKLNI